VTGQHPHGVLAVARQPLEDRAGGFGSAMAAKISVLQ